MVGASSMPGPTSGPPIRPSSNNSKNASLFPIDRDKLESAPEVTAEHGEGTTGNDPDGAAGEDELRQLFGLYGQTTGKGTVSRYWL